MRNYTVLFVDDEPSILKSLDRLFHGDHLRILTAHSGQEALDIIMRDSIEVLVSDNLMPGMTGVELVRKVKERSPKTVRILLSGFSDMNAILRALNEGEVFRFMLKPWVDVDLKAAVHLALAHYRLLEQNEELLASKTSLQHLVQLLSSKYPDIYHELNAICEADVSAEQKSKEPVPA